MPIDIVTQHTSIPVKIGVEKMKNEERNDSILEITDVVRTIERKVALEPFLTTCSDILF